MKNRVIGFFSIFIVVLLLYLYTMAPTVSFWDCGEFITCSYILGIPHPPGTPFFVLLGRIFSLLPTFKEIAARVNLLSALSGAIAAAMMYLIILKFIMRFKENKEEKPSLFVHIIAAGAALASAFAFSMWDNSVEAEVYAISTMIIAIGIWLTLHWSEGIGMKGNKNNLLLIVYITFLAMGVHLLPLLVLPGAIIFVLMVNWKELADTKLIGIGIGLAIIGVTTYAYLMIRAHLNPAINEADPQTFSALWDVFTRKQYGPMKMFPRKTQLETGLSFIPALWEQLRVYFKYFSWQYFPFPRENTGNLLKVLSIFGTYVYALIGIFGIYVHYRKDRKGFWLFFITFLLLSLGLVWYLNLKFSPSDPNPHHPPREVRERDYFFAPSFFFFSFYIAMALYYWGTRLREKRVWATYPFMGLAIIMGVIPIISNFKSHANRRHNFIANDYAYNMLISADDNAVVFTNGDNDTFPLWFMQYVKGLKKFDAKKKKGVMLANLSLLNTNWYIKQLKWAGIPIDFDSPFRGTRYEQLYNRQKRSGKYKGTFEEFVIDHLYPMKGEDGSILYVKDLAIRDIILASCGIKPTFEDLTMSGKKFVQKYINKQNFHPSINIYFSATVSYDNRQMYQNHLKMEGFMYKVVPENGYNMVDVDKTQELLIKDFKYRSIFDPNVYKDENTQRLLSNYSALYFTLARKLRMEVIPSPFVINPKTYTNIKLNEKQKEILKRSANIYLKALKFSKEERVISVVAIELKAIFSALKEYDTALKVMDELNKINPSALTYIYKGDIYREMGKYDEAEKFLNKAIENTPNDPTAYYTLIKLYLDRGDSSKVEGLLGTVIAQPKLFASIFQVAQQVNDRKMMILILKMWLKRGNPNDEQAKQFLDNLIHNRMQR